MAGLDASTALSIPRERDQFRALLDMQWRLFTRSMRNENARINFAFWLTGRILIIGLGLGAAVVCALLTWIFCSRTGRAPVTTFGVVLFAWQLLSLLRGTGNNGVENELLRFPLRLRTYIALWLSAGALEGITILGTWGCIGLFVGLVAAHGSLLRSFAAVALFFTCNLLLSRNILLWLGHLLARRRTREITLILLSLLGVLPRLAREESSHVMHFIHRLPLPPGFFRLLHGLPSWLGAHAAFGDVNPLSPLAGLLAWDVVLFALLVAGLRSAFRGEHLQEFAASSEPARLSQRTREQETSVRAAGRPAVVIAQMEWARLRHGGTVLYATLSPLLYVAFFGLRLARTHIGFWTFPMCAAYIGLSLRAFNVFGADGPGVQTFLLIPIPLRTVLIGKNLFAALFFLVELVATAVVIAIIAHDVSLPVLLFTALWAVFHMAIYFAAGNARSVRVPIAVAAYKASFRQARGGQQGGGWVMLLALFASVILGGLIGGAAAFWNHAWIAPTAMLPFSIGAAVWYRRSLRDPLLQGDIAAMESLALVVARTA